MNQFFLSGLTISELLAEVRQIVKEEISSTLTTSTPPTDGKVYLSAKEAAEFIGIKLQTLYQNRDRIPHVKKHGKLLFTRDGLIAYVEEK